MKGFIVVGIGMLGSSLSHRLNSSNCTENIEFEVVAEAPQKSEQKKPHIDMDFKINPYFPPEEYITLFPFSLTPHRIYSCNIKKSSGRILNCSLHKEGKQRIRPPSIYCPRDTPTYWTQSIQHNKTPLIMSKGCFYFIEVILR